jgi:hypothetical protein
MYTVVGIYNGTATVENNIGFIKKSKIRLPIPYDPATPLLGIYAKDLKAETQRDLCTLGINNRIIHNS